MDRHALCVINGLRGKCTGLITRQKTTIDSTERSVIDFVITSSDLIQHIDSMHIDDRRENVITKLVKKGKHVKKVESDHNLIVTKIIFPWNTTHKEPVEIFNFKDKESQKKFFFCNRQHRCTHKYN